jgi:hypothetical protein
MSKPITQIRQGDVLLVRRDPPENPTRATGPDGQPLAGLRVPGERSGHEHRLAARVYDDDAGTRVLFLERPTAMMVVRADDPDLEFLQPDGSPRHAAVEVPAGWWEPKPQRQYVPAARPVQRARFD